MLLGEVGQFNILTLNKAVGLEELVNLGRHGVEAGGAHAVACKYFSVGLGGDEILDARFQTTAAEGAEGNYLLST